MRDLSSKVSLKGVKTLRVTLCFNYMAKEFLCSLHLLFICNNFSVLTMLGDGFTSFSLFLNELKQSLVEKRASDKTIKSISQAQRQSVMKSAWAFYINILAQRRQGVTWVHCAVFAWLMLALVSLKPSSGHRPRLWLKSDVYSRLLHVHVGQKSVMLQNIIWTKNISLIQYQLLFQNCIFIQPQTSNNDSWKLSLIWKSSGRKLFKECC